MDQVLPYVLAVVPSIGVGFLFYLVIKAIIEGDRNERLAQSRWEAEQAGRLDVAGPGAAPAATDGPREADGPHDTAAPAGEGPLRS